MPLAAAIIPAVIGAGTAVYSAGQTSKASRKATAAQEAAAAEQRRVQQENMDRIQGLQQPFINVGYSALDKIAAKYGLPTASGQPTTPQRTSSYVSQNYKPGVTGAAGAVPATGAVDPGKAAARSDGTSVAAPTSQPATAAPAGAADGPDWGAYLNSNPDVAQEYERLVSTPEGQATLQANGGISPEEFAAHHYATAGQAEGRAIPQAQPQEPTGPTEAGRPTFDTPQYTRPDQPEWQDMGNGPSSADYLDPSKFTASPGYQFRLNEGNRNLNASYGAKGLLKSGGAIKGFTDYNQGMASSEFDKWFQQGLQRLNSDRGQFNADRQANFNIFNTNRNNTNANFDTDRQVGLTQFNNDRSVANNNFESDRGYAANRDDTATNNLFRLTAGGSNAAGSVGAASTNNANAQSNIYGNVADAQGTNAYNQGQANAQAVGAIGGAAANIFSRYTTPAVAAGSSSTGNYGNWTGGMGNWGF